MKLKSLFMLWFSLTSLTTVAKPLPVPMRIVSATTTADEILFELLQSKQERQRILALSPLANNPSYSHLRDTVKVVKKTFPASSEAILQLRPDLVILADFNKPSYKRVLTKVGLPYIELTAFQSLEGIATNIRRVGRAIGKEKSAVAFIERWQDELQALKPKQALQPKPRVMMYTPSGHAMAGDTIFDDVIRHCGGVNLPSMGGQKGWPKISTESLLQWNPDFIVVSHNDYGSLQKLKAKSMLRALQCKQRVIKTSNADLWSSSQYVLNLVKEVCAKLQGRKPC